MRMNCKTKLGKSAAVETLVSAILFLLTRYAQNQDRSLVQPIVEHFDWLANHPDIANSHFKDTCSRLALCWHSIQAEKQNKAALRDKGKVIH